MKTLNELRAERAALVKKSREFLETRANDMHLSAEDDAMYSKMEDDLSSYDMQIERMGLIICMRFPVGFASLHPRLGYYRPYRAITYRLVSTTVSTRRSADR